MKPVGYLFNRPEGLEGERGLYYNYIFASNGLFIEAENKLMEVRIPIAYCDIRGLAPLKVKINLTYGSIPQRFFDLSLSMFLSDIEREQYIAVIGDAGYHFYIPLQDKEGASVTYECGDKVVLEMHSHHKMGAWFSGTDDKDETGLKVYGVVGNLDKTPIVRLRLGVYGYYMPLAWKEVFDGALAGAIELEEEEVIDEDELHCEAGRQPGPPENRGGWMRWYRRLRGRGAMPDPGQQQSRPSPD
jgi:PRTRC genetic system protein A